MITDLKCQMARQETFHLRTISMKRPRTLFTFFQKYKIRVIQKCLQHFFTEAVKAQTLWIPVLSVYGTDKEYNHINTQ